MPSVAVKGIKISVAVPASEFPFDEVPPKGSPGSKTLMLPYQITTDGVTVVADIKAQALQRLAEQTAAAGGAGFVVVQGKLGPGGRMVEVGLVFQPPSPPKQAA